jgi:glycosyltransferase involved in cell wall biosynthesis
VPVVATAVNAVSDVVVPGVSGLLVPPQEPGMLADAVDHLLADPRLARAMADEAQRRLAGRYDTASLGGTLTAAYLPPDPRPTPVPIRPRTRAALEGSSRAR